jgi:AGZA family xanthine/uracil permease-like MFS transporter
MTFRKFFKFDELGTTWKTETLAGFTTFLTIAYIIIVNPAILKAAGIPQGPSMVATVLGTTTTSTYIESATGIEEGGKSGFTAVVTALLFLAALFFTPILTSAPACAFGPVLIVVGMLMLKPILDLNFDDMTELAPAFLVIVLMSFTYNLGVGMTAGFVVYPLMKTVTGKYREIPSGIWVLSVLSVLYYIFGA